MTGERNGRGGARPTAVAVVLLAAAAVLLWAASRMTWVDAVSADGLGEEQSTAIDGGTWAAATTPLALALVAAIAATFAVRGWAVRVVALLVALVAVAAAVPALTLLASGAPDERVAQLAELPGRAEVHSVVVHPLGAVLVVVGAVIALAAALALARRPRASGGLSSKYDAPAARRAAATAVTDEPVTQRMMWDALDAGDDPTVESDDGAGSAADDGVGSVVDDGAGLPRGETESGDGPGPGRRPDQSAD
ncbi:TIGR02234 family membrane protein [Rhodococcus triatomae]|uniref:Trp region conserved hypothetical membrane protein n=1 Tax=Rhodococcus triatomae TaxID=300028 RepID=A0A1G8CSN9_9NOCA|nr:TIGR02234 family membrane protein [Rhodococcus triatomae]QNG18588.1 TIGR02234 family membrane protein [Rhodococcus triatomae]QNG21743.1 TIGR02234 family membrane protein [Rhodococcus triatomae]SDH48189.1 trp region conserved hypothetical membrane protein [Rhodococcus triatomae]